MSANALNQLDPRKLGQNLKIARKQRGLSQSDAAKVIGVARTTLLSIEQGQRRIKYDELIQLASAYGKSVSAFLRQRPEARDFRVQFRGSLQANKIEQSKIAGSEAEFQELCRDYVELERIMQAPLPYNNYPPEYQISHLKPMQAAEEVANQERRRLGLGDSPLPLLRSIFERDVGLRIFYLAFEDSRFSEMYYFDEELGGCLAVNKHHPEERRRWSLSHGYAHFLVHRYQPTIHIEGVFQRELFADYFAKFFLMPTNGLQRRYNDLLRSRSKPSIGDLCVLANYYGVSLAALVRRLEDMGIAPKGTWERLRDRGFKVRQAQAQLGLAPIPEQANLLPLRYQFLAVEAYQEGKISEGLLANFLRVDRIDARSIVQQLSIHASDITNEKGIDLELDNLVKV